MKWFEVLVLGLIQGLTEFLPVSSSGHLEIAKALFGIDPETSFYFTVSVHGATVLSTTGAFIILIGFITAFVSGYIACRWMIGLVKRSKLIWFAIYCTAAGLLSVILG